MITLRQTTSRTVALNEFKVWEADKRLLPSYLCTSDNSRRIEYYKKALRIALKTKLTETQRDQLKSFYAERLTKTEIGKRYGVGSSAICKSLKIAENQIRDYVEMFMQVYDLLEREKLRDDDEYGELQGGC